MTDINHASITDPYLHEPKGVAAASSGQVYVANGSGSGAWQSQTTTNGAVKQVNLYNSTQTITIPTGVTRAFVKMWGGGGGSGGSNSSTFASAGGGAGGYLESYLTSLAAGNTLSYTQGAAGAAGSTSGTSGTAGGNSILASGTQTITTLTANGGSPSVGSVTGTFAGGAGGTATNGNIINLTGQKGGYAIIDATDSTWVPGIGGSTMYCQGGYGCILGSSNGNAGSAGGLLVYWYT